MKFPFIGWLHHQGGRGLEQQTLSTCWVAYSTGGSKPPRNPSFQVYRYQQTPSRGDPCFPHFPRHPHDSHFLSSAAHLPSFSSPSSASLSSPGTVAWSPGTAATPSRTWTPGRFLCGGSPS